MLDDQGDSGIFSSLLDEFESASEGKWERRRNNLEVPAAHAVSKQKASVVIVIETGSPDQSVCVRRAIM